MSVGRGLTGKIKELGFFLKKIEDISKIIKEKHKIQDYPLNNEVAELNYYFCAFLNTVQSLKDASQTAMDIKISWSKLSDSYGKFIYYCRNAITHDGAHMINSGKENKYYITGRLRRINDRGEVVELEPPTEDVVALSRMASKEVLSTIKKFISKHGSSIPLPNQDDFKRSFEKALNLDFLPSYAKNMMKDNQDTIFSSFPNEESIIEPIINEIEIIEKHISTSDT